MLRENSETPSLARGRNSWQLNPRAAERSGRNTSLKLRNEEFNEMGQGHRGRSSHHQACNRRFVNHPRPERTAGDVVRNIRETKDTAGGTVLQQNPAECPLVVLALVRGHPAIHSFRISGAFRSGTLERVKHPSISQWAAFQVNRATVGGCCACARPPGQMIIAVWKQSKRREIRG
jgi:hypothetical protein